MLIAIASLKGGVGKTTTAIHLSTYLQTDKPTLLIDADRNRSALVWAKEDNLPFTVASQAGSPAFIPKHQHIVTDMKAGPEEEDLVDLAKGNDLIIIPTTPNHLDLDATVKAVEFFKKWNINNYKILLTKVDARTTNSKTAKQFLVKENIPLFKTEIPLLIAFERASQNGKTVKDYHDFRAKQAWQQYAQVGKEVINN
ncbi:chromosome (plasmid) partitioning protein ParA [Geminocystis sp. NIES-3708]|uniref:ParA family protein n=1 Tax=Geminocystis sp. NIES-3708 TaxID=1615909 RepID=UPI0005FC7B01|nr:ParA family protein [Geminocystis sp. NIES-3708]BAQ59735.1 chromosome (plasmid) partitioning protein ParA [Geminocystis sp. NIES-3708]